MESLATRKRLTALSCAAAGFITAQHFKAVPLAWCAGCRWEQRGAAARPENCPLCGSTLTGWIYNAKLHVK